jgi:hypothetical protein
MAWYLPEARSAEQIGKQDTPSSKSSCKKRQHFLNISNQNNKLVPKYNRFVRI